MKTRTFKSTLEDKKLTIQKSIPQLRAEKELSEQSKIRATWTWQKASKYKRIVTPFCEDPFCIHPHPVPATEVHHKKPLVTHPELAFEFDNLMSVCGKCHWRLDKGLRVKEKDSLPKVSSFK